MHHELSSKIKRNNDVTTRNLMGVYCVSYIQGKDIRYENHKKEKCSVYMCIHL